MTRPASWIIREKATRKIIMETFDRKTVNALNTDKYEAVPILDYLYVLNRRIKSGRGARIRRRLSSRAHTA